MSVNIGDDERASLDAARNQIGAALYRGFRRVVESNENFKRYNRGAYVAKYASCQFYGATYIIKILGATQLSSDLLDQVRQQFECPDISALMNSNTIEFSIPLNASVSADMRYPPSLFSVRGAKEFFDNLIEPSTLLVLLMSLVFLFLAMSLVYYVTEDQKKQVFGHIIGLFSRSSVPTSTPTPSSQPSSSPPGTAAIAASSSSQPRRPLR
jgi:hypothetical protein